VRSLFLFLPPYRENSVTETILKEEATLEEETALEDINQNGDLKNMIQFKI
jgi:hypothetical protein